MQTVEEETKEDLREVGEKGGGVWTTQERGDKHTRYLRA